MVSIDRKQFAKYNERNLTAPKAIYSTTTGLFRVKLSKIQ
ncbi:hypothetical protein T10_184 [Trichinella papuae]|uniref:Uncharacterized protein n=1 Tax=Trichinella papuae TaxID=268474 RepID=A0A0V1LXX9_9BILA|nr:hypothetical protein T10_184 [Trichinella papuae]